MNANDLLQALQYSVGKTGEEIKLAEKFLKDVFLFHFPSFIFFRLSPKMDTSPTFWSFHAIKT